MWETCQKQHLEDEIFAFKCWNNMDFTIRKCWGQVFSGGVHGYHLRGSGANSQLCTSHPKKKKKRRFNFSLQLITPEGIQMSYHHREGAKMARN